MYWVMLLSEGTPMNEVDLDARLRSAAPRIASGVGLAEHGMLVLDDARQRRRRRSRAWVAAATASLALIGGGTVAVAGNGTQTPWGWTADAVYEIPGPSGQTCFAGLVVKPDGAAPDAEVVLQARQFVSGLDLDSLDTSAARAELEAENDQPYDDGTPGVFHYTDEDIAQSAMHQTVAGLLFAELEARGFSADGDEG